MSQHPFALYNPALLPPETLLAEFTARLPLLDTLLGVIRGNAAGQPPQHCLLIGVRGMGKTTMLWAIAHRVARDSSLNQVWQPVVFDEESRRVGDLADFWLEALRQWEYATRSSDRSADRLLDAPTPDIESRARDSFLEAVQRSGRRALLLIDNLSDLLASIHDPEPLHRLRAFLMEESRVMIIGSATRYFDEVTSVDQPFFEFFRCFELRSLSLEEMRGCLLALAETHGDTSIRETVEQHAGTVRALHLLTGGNPRLIKTFYRLLRDGLRGDIRADLERLLDEFTPYFKAIIDALPVQQQRIFDAVALAWDPVEVSSLAVATRLPSNQVSAQLRALVKAGLVGEALGRPKRKTYLLADRFSNIHYLMRHGRAARSRFDWFVALVRIVFPDREATEILSRVASEAAECGPSGLDDARWMLNSALNRAESANSRRAFLDATVRESWDRETFKSFDYWFDIERARVDLPEIDIIAFCKLMPAALRKRIGYSPDDAKWWYGLTDFLEERAEWRIAEGTYRKAIELDPNYAHPWDALGNLLQDHLGRPAEAETAYRKAIELDPNYAPPWNGLGNLLQDYLGRPAEAETAYCKAIELDPKFANPWNNLGNLLQVHLGRPAEAEAAYRKAIQLNPKLAVPWNNLGCLFQDHRDRHPAAEAAFREAIDLDPKFAPPWHGLGYLLDYHLGRPAEAEAAYRRAIELDPNYASSWNNLGYLLQDQLGRPAEAEAAYRKAIELDPEFANPWSGLAKVLSARDGTSSAEARSAAVTGLSLGPSRAFARSVFLRLCADQPDAWRSVLPNLSRWCAAHPESREVFDFTIDGYLRFAQLSRPAEALGLLNGVPVASAFETLRDSFLAFDDREYLHRLAPERQAIALELIRRMTPAPGKPA